ncbi:hypothetical protein Cni_G28748 [Canna indica]|uniref:Uncharacterized protein n=1 Tax=Canna indica TaxID=4628 RepID=A0AAQ3L7W5_9LILI|nr:hypothetical protein Cni_G28748 [Canna indica]
MRRVVVHQIDGLFLEQTKQWHRKYTAWLVLPCTASDTVNLPQNPKQTKLLPEMVTSLRRGTVEAAHLHPFLLLPSSSSLAGGLKLALICVPITISSSRSKSMSDPKGCLLLHFSCNEDY